MKARTLLAVAFTVASLSIAPARSAGMLKPMSAAGAAPEIRSHDVQVTVLDGFARTQVTQTFHNGSDATLEAVYTCPVPLDGSLSELSIEIGERRMQGEVLPREKAQDVYEEQKAAGGDAALGTQEGYERYEFKVANIPPGGDVKVEFVYYQPLAIDTGVGRYVYPLADGGNETAARSFWTRDPKLHGPLTFALDLRSSWPIDDVRVAGHESDSSVKPIGEGEYRVELTQQDAALDRDLVVYYRLRDGLPGRLEMLAYRDASGEPGTFMLVLTPGIDLAPITTGADYCFVLDVSGSMAPHLAVMADGIAQSLQHLNPKDRFRIVQFSDSASDVTNGWRNATPEEVQAAIDHVKGLGTQGGTDLHEGLSLGVKDLNADRPTNLVLITDGVANQGVLDPREFKKLMQRTDLRVFAFVVGGEANWPLMRIVGEASGGIVAGVSDADDVLGQVTLAKEKIGYEALHDADLSISGVKTSDVSGNVLPKIYRGQQLVTFGRYERGGDASITFKTKQTGADQTYRANVHFPDVDESTPELERLWALQRIQSLERARDLGLGEGADEEITGLGVKYQLVTEQTSMLVLDDAEFDKRGIARSNRERTQRERAAQQVRAAAPPVARQVDAQQPMFQQPAALIGGGGGGAMEPWAVLAGLALAVSAWLALRQTGAQ